MKNNILRRFFMKHIYYPYCGVRYKVKTYYYNVVRFIENLLYIYIPVAWVDRQWDNDYTYYVLYRKFKHLHNSFKEETGFLSVDHDKICRQVLYASRLCKRIYEDNYEDKCYSNKYYNVIMYNRSFPDLTKFERYHMNKFYDRSIKARQEDKKSLYLLLNKYSDRWWT